MRPLTEADLPWLRMLCKKRYAAHYDAYSTERWFVERVLREPLQWYAVRTDDAFLIAIINMEYWRPAFLIVDILFVCADDGAMWQAMALLRASQEWAESRRARYWRLCGDTDFDLTPLAMRLGAKAIYPRCVAELKRWREAEPAQVPARH